MTLMLISIITEGLNILKGRKKERERKKEKNMPIVTSGLSYRLSAPWVTHISSLRSGQQQQQHRKVAMLIPYELVGDGLTRPFYIMGYAVYRQFYTLRRNNYLKRKGLQYLLPYEYRDNPNKQMGIIR
jgi:hypothetical protein